MRTWLPKGTKVLVQAPCDDTEKQAAVIGYDKSRGCYDVEYRNGKLSRYHHKYVKESK